MLYKVIVREVATHVIMVEAESEEQASILWTECYGDADFDEVIREDAEMLEVELDA